MIKAEIYTQSDGKIVAFVISGHSHVGGPGYDIYCAEISTLSYAARICIKDYLNRDILMENYEHGGLGIELEKAPDELTEAVFQEMLIGLRAVETVAPRVLQIEFIEMDEAAAENLHNRLKGMSQSQGNTLPDFAVEQVKIRADIYQNAEGKILGFDVKERKDFEMNQLKIYCAGIWSLAKSAYLCAKDYLKRELEVETDSGILKIKLKTPPDEVTEAVFQMMLMGMREIENLKPEALKINIGGESNV